MNLPFFALGCALNVALAGMALWRRSLTPAAALTGFILGLLIWFGGGAALWIALGAFFVGSLFLERLQRVFQGTAEAAAAIHKKTGTRDFVQVAANALFPALAAVGFFLTGRSALLVAAVAGIAASTADTWAGEIGVMSPHRPVSIVTFSPVVPGLSGGVTFVGTFGAAAGAAFIALVFGLMARVGLEPRGGSLGSRSFLIIVAAGFFGAMLDSLLGATIQERFRDEAGRVTERPRAADGTNHIRAGGIPGVTNDVVNLVCSAVVTGIVAII